MAARASDRPIKRGKPPAPSNWLEELDRRVRELPAGSDWLEDSALAPQRCRRFIMARFPELPRPFAPGVLCSELSRGEKQIGDSEHADRILRGLNVGQRSQLAGLFLDVIEALETYTGRRQSSRKVQELAPEAERRTRMLFRKVFKIRRELEGLRKYAKRLHPLLGLEYIRAAGRCLKTLANLKEDPSAGEYYRSLKSEYPTLEDPRQLGMVELYWFFRHSCGVSGDEAEVRVALIRNAFWTDFKVPAVSYLPGYQTAGESKGCPAVRQAVRRWKPEAGTPR